VLDFIGDLPKCELHVHLEGTLEPSMRRALAARHQSGTDVPPAGGPGTGTGTGDSAPAPASGGDTAGNGQFGTLATFLDAYYDAMAVLVDEEDFFDLTLAYLTTAHRQRVLYSEMFFDPQAHTKRGVAFDTVISGIHRAQEEAAATLGIRSQLVLCFLRDEDAESAMATLEAALAYRQWIVGVGLDSDENGNPPVKFEEVFRRARAEGFRLTMHCDPRQPDSLTHLRQCLDVIDVERIDHGVSCLQDDTIRAEIARRGLGLTVCPLSNRQIYGDLMADEIATMLRLGLRVTCNSDDPAYFGGYMNENFRALHDAGFTAPQLAQLSRNAFEVAWLPRAERDRYISAVDRHVEQFEPAVPDAAHHSDSPGER